LHQLSELVVSARSNQRSSELELDDAQVGPAIATPKTDRRLPIARHSRSHGKQADPILYADGRPDGKPGSAVNGAPDPRILALGEETERHPHGGE